MSQAQAEPPSSESCCRIDRIGVAWLTHPLPRRLNWLTVASRARCSDSALSIRACADCQHKLTCRIDDEGVLGG